MPDGNNPKCVPISTIKLTSDLAHKVNLGIDLSIMYRLIVNGMKQK